MSIGEIGDALRQVVAQLPFACAEAAVGALDMAIIDLAAVVNGTQSADAELALACFSRGREQLIAAQRTLILVQATIEQFVRNIGVTDGNRQTASSTDTAGSPASRPAVGIAAESAGKRIEQALVSQAQQQGLKINSDGVARIGLDSDGRIVWLERGRPGAGLDHILEPARVVEFGRGGVPESDIADLVFQAATRGRPVGISSRDRVVFELDFQGLRRRVAITVADNGFIVGAHPISLDRKLKPLP